MKIGTQWLFTIFFATLISFQAEARRQYAQAPNSVKANIIGLWENTADSVVEVGNQRLHQGECKTLDIQVSQQLLIKLDCAGVIRNDVYSLKSTENVMVNKSQGQWTLIRYDYLNKRPQVSRMNQSSLKIPYVAEVIHLRIHANNELAFYSESFRVDEFGRIVQSKLIQAHGLRPKAKDMRVSSR